MERVQPPQQDMTPAHARHLHLDAHFSKGLWSQFHFALHEQVRSPALHLRVWFRRHAEADSVRARGLVVVALLAERAFMRFLCASRNVNTVGTLLRNETAAFHDAALPQDCLVSAIKKLLELATDDHLDDAARRLPRLLKPLEDFRRIEVDLLLDLIAIHLKGCTVSIPVPVVLTASGVVAERRVSVFQLDKYRGVLVLLSLFHPSGFVRMVDQGQLFVRLLYFVERRILVNAQDLVVVDAFVVFVRLWRGEVCLLRRERAIGLCSRLVSRSR
mmetsp:Transcript_44895/g.124417  ORF Transcript_44895/g.124417 Transcript_44895/m.124417 type:complete len:273 (+) Transcript_44895:357-1175(+)